MNRTELEALREAATPGPWIFSTAMNRMILRWDSRETVGFAENHANAAFIVALVNAYTEGKLVFAPDAEDVALVRDGLTHQEYVDEDGYLEPYTVGPEPDVEAALSRIIGEEKL